MWIFLSTPSVRRATHAVVKDRPAHKISIHALREEGDCMTVSPDTIKLISIHALREEGDSMWSWEQVFLQNFYPRPP